MRLSIALVLACFAGRAQQPNAPVTSTRFDCALSGTVVNRVTGERVPRAKVVLMTARGTRNGVADNSGQWAFRDLPCGNVAVFADRFGFLESQQPRGESQSVLLLAQSPATTVQVQLTPQSVITGKVVDENGDPVPDMRVVPYVVRVRDGRRTLGNAPQAVTDDRGAFRIPRLAPGRYIVCADPPLGEVTYDESCYPAPVQAGVASAMKISPGQEAEVYFNLRSIRPAQVSGIVTGIPAGAGASVALSRDDGIHMVPGLNAGVQPDGRFSFRAVPPGSYVLTATSFQGHNAPSAHMHLDVTPAGIEGITVALEPPITISGTLRFDSENQESDTGSRVRISLQSATANTASPAARMSDDRKTFTIEGVPPADYRLVVSAPNAYVESARLGGRDVADGEFTIDSAPGPLEIVISDKGGGLEGDVVAQDGSPAENATVLLVRQGKFAGIYPVQNGHFNLSTLQPGDYKVSAWDNPQEIEYANPQWMRQNAPGGVDASIQAGQNAQVKLTRQTAPADY